MTQIIAATDKKDSEEFWNVLTHGIGFLLAIPILVFLIIEGVAKGSTLYVVSFTIFGISTMLLFLASTVYHAASEKYKRFFRIIDHCSIYVLIAGTYTPFALIAIGGKLGWTIFAIEWGIALCGVLFKMFFIERFKAVSLICYLAMGWLIIIAFKTVVSHITMHGFYYLLAGGLMYTIGAFFFANHKIPYNHAIWHVFVLAGSGFMIGTVMIYV
ncbi:PAQR family membrane homeostasis protein TrhA [Kurthia massiliensis]|uniref:PAQR family membrane homeostasis protein TrhA n=1 Tax=Kurthia massiliensis TaxID=1033739 RepID=UPI000289E3A0|nr:hemolysin III family protein [Kurthia massiliensis]